MNLTWSTMYTNITDDPFYINPNNIPISPLLPLGIINVTYCFPKNEISEASIKEISYFVHSHNKVQGDNISELSIDKIKKLSKISSIISTLWLKDMIIGVILAVVLPFNKGKTLYATHLCVHERFRSNGLAMYLIRSMLIAGTKYDSYHSYYLSPSSHQGNAFQVNSWFRPINANKMRSIGFDIESHNYKIKNNTTTPVSIQDYNTIINKFRQGDIYLSPTLEEFKDMMKFFDIYRVGNEFFILYNGSVIIKSKGKRVNITYLSWMSDVSIFKNVLYQAKRNKTDVLYGIYIGHITQDLITKNMGHTTEGKMILEMYNTKISIPLEKFMLPIF